jgi:hypothetical protein
MTKDRGAYSMPEKTTIWTLNRAYDLISGPQEFPVKKSAEEVQKELCDLFDNKIQFGQRPDSGNQLMPGPEYFVPIAPKCIGSLYETSQGRAKELLDNIKAYYEQVAKQSPYQTFWDQEMHGYQMQTQDYTGYYALLEKTAPNILIGYSQGGLVSRYLNYLDKNVFQKNVIQGVITISSPNFGSPLANSENIASIIKGFVQIVCVLLGIKDQRVEGILMETVTYDDLVDFLKQIGQAMGQEAHVQKLDAQEQVKNQRLAKWINDLYNWLGGLRNDPNNAFFDLNLLRTEPNYSQAASICSVLAAIQQPLDNPNPIAGVLSANMSSKAFVYDLFIEVVISALEKHLTSHQPLVEMFAAEKITIQTGNQKMSDDKFTQIDTIYSQIVMQENHTQPITNPVLQNVLDWHTQGITPPGLEAYAHDFIIPSAYQLTLDNEQKITPENSVNPEANHLSGSDLIFEAARKNREDVLGYLKKIL